MSGKEKKGVHRCPIIKSLMIKRATSGLYISISMWYKQFLWKLESISSEILLELKKKKKAISFFLCLIFLFICVLYGLNFCL
ncbi:hypothetical protein ACOSQ3_002140 [Xanthoceras sorbifolium]